VGFTRSATNGPQQVDGFGERELLSGDAVYKAPASNLAFGFQAAQDGSEFSPKRRIGFAL
jgi:hypothetical protein